MLKSIFTAFFSIVLMVCFSQGIEFFEGEWEKAMEKAASEDKLIFVDAFTTWCGPCKKMSKQVFPNAKVGTIFNANFINIKMNMETEKGRAFNAKYRVTGYPTFLFINEKGDLVHRVSGFRPVASFVDVAKVAIRKDDKSAVMLKEYEKGNREYNFILKYIKALNRAGKSSIKVSNEYISSKPEITKKQKTALLYEAVSEADSRLFSELMKLRKVLAVIKTESQIILKITNACTATVLKAIDFQSEDLLKEAQSKMHKYVPKKAKGFEIESNMNFFEAMGDIDYYLKQVKKYASIVIHEYEKELIVLSSHVNKEYSHYAKANKISESIARKAIEVNETADGLMNYSRILLSNGKKAEAIKNSKKALASARLKGGKTTVIERYIQFLESE